MGYIPLYNYKYDSGPRRIQTGPDHEGYIVVSSGIVDTGADNGVIVAGPPNSGSWYLTNEWRAVPPAVEGFWTNYNDAYYPEVSGALNTSDGYRPLGTSKLANAKVQTAYGANFGERRGPSYTYFGGAAPDNQNYDPYNTPAANTAAEGITGGGVTHRRYEGGLLTNTLGSQGTSNRSEWQYNPPVYCKTYTRAERAAAPGLMSAVIRSVYRGGSTRYVYNIGSVYYQNSESVRNLVRTFSSSVNSSNQIG